MALEVRKLGYQHHHVLDAADAYLAAAVSAAEQQKAGEATRYAEKVRLLAMSPLLSAAQSRALLERIV